MKKTGRLLCAAAIALTAQGGAALAAEWKGGIGPLPLSARTTTTISIYNPCATTASFTATGVELKRGVRVLNSTGTIEANRGHQIVLRTLQPQSMLLLHLAVVCEGETMPAPLATARFVNTTDAMFLNYEEISWTLK